MQSSNKIDIFDGDNQFLLLDLASLEEEILQKYDEKGIQVFLELFDRKYEKVRVEQNDIITTLCQKKISVTFRC